MSDIRQFKHFIAVVEAGGIRQAARQVHLTPSSVQRSIKQLEEHYGIKLFGKQGKSLRLTLNGELLLEEARALVTGFDKIAPKLEQQSDIGSGNIRVGLAPAVADLFMPAVTGRLITDYPTVQVSTLINTADVLLRELQEKRIDLAIGLENVFVATPNLSLKRIYAAHPAWTVRPGHPLLQSKNPKISELAHYPLIAQHFEPIFLERLMDMLRMAGLINIRRIPLSQCDNFRLLYDLTLASDAVLLAGDINIKSCKCACALKEVHFKIDLPAVNFSAIYPKMKTPLPLVLRYLEILQEEFSKIASVP
ncbi:LysR family transcriptional regulator [Pontiellaceae bacterium B1224]|nr:LysR family transcriptional regulator [Pontiellaceae bacterium B1224]